MKVVGFVLALMLATTATRAEGQMPPQVPPDLLRPPNVDELDKVLKRDLEERRKSQT